MRFTYKSYGNLLSILRSNGYEFADYFNWQERKKCVILRHDIDYDIQMAHHLAAFEQDEGCSSTYFVILTSDFYNVFSVASRKLLKEIVDFGHEIGLHFDEVQYPDIAGDANAVSEKILWEAKLLGESIGQEVRTVSMHRPSKGILESDISIQGIENSYGKTYVRDFKYLSDSRRHWREPVEEIIESGEYERLHILTHPFWYHDDELDMHSTVEGFINRGSWQRYEALNVNFTKLSEVMKEDEVDGMRGGETW